MTDTMRLYLRSLAISMPLSFIVGSIVGALTESSWVRSVALFIVGALIGYLTLRILRRKSAPRPQQWTEDQL